jgi:hypothetical protein
MHLVFSYVHPTKPSCTLGPVRSIWLNIQGMRSEENGPIRAAYQEHQWRVEGEQYFRLDCTAKVQIHFTADGKSSAQYGPYQRFSAVNGLAYGDDRVIAFLDYKRDQWLFYDTGYHWTEMIVTEIP